MDDHRVMCEYVIITPPPPRDPTRTEQIVAASLYLCIAFMVGRFAVLPVLSLIL